MSAPVSEYCRARIAAEFPEHERAAALELLGAYGAEPHHREAERIRRDVLQLAEGKLEKLRHFLQLAARDYRDLIVCAEYVPDPGRPGAWNLRKIPTPWLEE